MRTPLLTTKLFAPRVRPGLVGRTRLAARLDTTLSKRLTLVSASAGFGKTTLLAQWLQDLESTRAGAPASGGHPLDAGEPQPRVAWLSLEPSDNDAARFCAYVLSALTDVAPEATQSGLALLGSSQPPPVSQLLVNLLNDLGAADRDVVLLLDDYHVIESAEVHEAVNFVLEHAPPSLHLVVASRVDPPLPLARLRARGDLVEVRAADLRFTAEEASAYLNDTMGLGLTQPQLAALEGRTEGWIAALQLAALSLQGRDDVAGFISQFAGDDRYIVDYLVEEVLHRLPPHMQAFLLHTCVLDRLSADLCDAVTGGNGGRDVLEEIERGNLFVVPLDDQRRWYRYHHLFADVLRARLLATDADLVPRLHRRASDWFEDNDSRTEAIAHAMAARDFDRAADLMERSIPEVRRDRTEAQLCAWLERVPAEVLRRRPVLSLAYAGALLSTNTLTGVEQLLDDTERWLNSTERTVSDDTGDRGEAMVVVDEESYRRLPVWVAVYRAALAQASGDTATAVRHARQALAIAETEGEDPIVAAAASALLGLASWASGDLDTAHAAYTRCQATFLDAGYLTDVLGTAVTLAEIRLTQGRLHDAARTYEQALASVEAAGAPNGSSAGVLRGTVDMYIGLADVRREQNELDAARELLGRARDLGDHLGLPQSRYRWHAAMARVHVAEGDLAAADVMLAEARRSYTSDFLPDVRPVPAMRARVWVAQGRTADGLAWAREAGVGPADNMSYLREYEHVTLARCLLSTPGDATGAHSFAAVRSLLTRLDVAATTGGRAGTALEVAVLLALAHHRHGDTAAARAHLGRALHIGLPEGYARVFLDEGPDMVALLRDAIGVGAVHGELRGQVLELLSQAAPGTEPSATSPGPGGGSAAQGERTADGFVIEPLSGRERDVLRLLGTDLAGPDIARELVLSVNTVRTHTKNIYAKLGVNTRRAAVRRGHELRLLEGSGGP